MNGTTNEYVENIHITTLFIITTLKLLTEIKTKEDAKAALEKKDISWHDFIKH